MSCKREARFRHNTIAFWLSNEEKQKVEARIILSGLPKGDYYRRSILGQRITVCGDRYHSAKLAVTLEKLYTDCRKLETDTESPLMAVLTELLKIWRDQEDAGD